MAITEIDGFKFLDNEMIVVEMDRVNEYVEYIIKKQIKSVYLCNLYFRHNTIDFLKEIDFIENLSITSSGIMDLQVLHYLSNLKKLSIEEPESFLNLESLESLNELGIRMNKYVVGMEQLKKLKILRLYNYNPPSKSLSELNKLSSIEELKITNSSIESFWGCDALTKLKRFELNYLKKMSFIDELEQLSNTLKILEFSSCKKIKNHEYVSCLHNLERLAFNECSDIESISFIEKMHNLKSFVFMNTNVCDGNLISCEKLEYVAFSNKKHFSHKIADFNK